MKRTLAWIWMGVFWAVSLSALAYAVFVSPEVRAFSMILAVVVLTCWSLVEISS